MRNLVSHFRRSRRVFEITVLRGMLYLSLKGMELPKAEVSFMLIRPVVEFCRVLLMVCSSWDFRVRGLHHKVFVRLFKNTTFRGLDMLPSSGMGPHRVGALSPHLRTETDAVAETCSLIA
jgi:hypothetical protein